MIQLAKIVGGLVLDWFQSKREEKQAKHQRKMEYIANEATWNQSAQNNAGSSWKDEYWTIIITVPLIMAFIPPLAPYVIKGFDSLKHVPDWYKAFAAASVAASFGIKQISSAWGSRRKNETG